MRKLRRVGSGEDDPLDGVANFFDLGLVFALAFMVPLMARLASSSQSTATRSAQTHRTDAKPQDQVKVDHYKSTNDPLSGEGTRLGVAYRLKSGEVVYIPDKDGKGQ